MIGIDVPVETVDAAPPPAVAVNKKELARALGCALPTLDKLIDRYPDFPIERRGHEGVGYEFDPVKVDAFLTDQREAEAAAAADRMDLLSGMTNFLAAENGTRARTLFPVKIPWFKE